MNSFFTRLLAGAVLFTLIVPVAARADYLSSSHYEIDAIGFIPADNQLDFAPPVISAQGPVVTDITGTTAVVQWTTDVLSSSVVAFGLTSAYGTQMGQANEQVTSHSVTLTGLSPFTTYHYQVESEDAMGHFGYSGDSTFTTAKQANISSVLVSDITLNSAIVTWTTSTVTSSSIVYGPTTDYGSSFNDQSAGFTTAHTVRLANLTSGTTYHFQIKGIDNVNQSVSSDDYVFSTLTLPSIKGYTIGPLTGTSAHIAWTTNIPTDSFISYWLAGQSQSQATDVGEHALISDHSVDITGLTGQTQYNFIIIGRDTYGNTTNTNTLSFKTPLDTIPPVISEIKSEVNTSVSDNTLQLIVSWTTDKPATSQIEYNIGMINSDKHYAYKSRVDSVLGTSHILIIDNLKPSTNYHFRIKAVDASGNIGYSSDYSILTPQQQKSLLQIILSKLEDTFGWLRKV